MGQRGIISCLKFNPDYSGAYAAGSYAHNITIYAENMRESVLELDNLEFGVTCLRWSPCGNMLWAGKCHCNEVSVILQFFISPLIEYFKYCSACPVLKIIIRGIDDTNT